MLFFPFIHQFCLSNINNIPAFYFFESIMAKPQTLKNRINLKDKAAIVGVEDRVEIWNDKAWSQNQEVVEKQAGELAEKLGNEGK